MAPFGPWTFGLPFPHSCIDTKTRRLRDFLEASERVHLGIPRYEAGRKDEPQKAQAGRRRFLG